MSTVYDINKGINTPIEFKGVKAQYIKYLAAGMIALLLLFVILYKVSGNIYLALGIIAPVGVTVVTIIQRFSNKYGENGLKKKMAVRYLPKAIISTSRKVFVELKSRPQ